MISSAFTQPGEPIGKRVWRAPRAGVRLDGPPRMKRGERRGEIGLREVAFVSIGLASCM